MIASLSFFFAIMYYSMNEEPFPFKNNVVHILIN